MASGDGPLSTWEDEGLAQRPRCRISLQDREEGCWGESDTGTFIVLALRVRRLSRKRERLFLLSLLARVPRQQPRPDVRPHSSRPRIVVHTIWNPNGLLAEGSAAICQPGVCRKPCSTLLRGRGGSDAHLSRLQHRMLLRQLFRSRPEGSVSQSSHKQPQRPPLATLWRRTWPGPRRRRCEIIAHVGFCWMGGVLGDSVPWAAALVCLALSGRPHLPSVGV